MSSDAKIPPEPDYELDLYKCNLPDDIHAEYHKSIVDKSKVYVAVFITPDGPPRIWLESTKEPNLSGFCRVFFKDDDVTTFLNTIASSINGSISLKKLETTYESISEVISGLDKKNRDAGGKGINLYACTIYRDVVRIVDLFWSSNKDIVI